MSSTTDRAEVNRRNGAGAARKPPREKRGRDSMRSSTA